MKVSSNLLLVGKPTSKVSGREKRGKKDIKEPYEENGTAKPLHATKKKESRHSPSGAGTRSRQFMDVRKRQTVKEPVENRSEACQYLEKRREIAKKTKNRLA